MYSVSIHACIAEEGKEAMQEKRQKGRTEPKEAEMGSPLENMTDLDILCSTPFAKFCNLSELLGERYLRICRIAKSIYFVLLL